MQYPELAAFDSTPDQDLALQIQMKTDPGTGAVSPGDYLLKAAVLALLDGWVQRHVGVVLNTRVIAEFEKASPAERASGDWAKKIDLTIDVPSAVKP